MNRLMSIIIFTMLFVPCFTVTPTYATEYNLKQMTSKVEEALFNRKTRFDQLEFYKEKGVIGENNQGYVVLLSDDPQAKDITEMENKDRKVIYQTIAEQNGITDQIDVIGKVFAQVQHEKAKAGYRIQDSDGQWKEK